MLMKYITWMKVATQMLNLVMCIQCFVIHVVEFCPCDSFQYVVKLINLPSLIMKFIWSMHVLSSCNNFHVCVCVCIDTCGLDYFAIKIFPCAIFILSINSFHIVKVHWCNYILSIITFVWSISIIWSRHCFLLKILFLSHPSLSPSSFFFLFLNYSHIICSFPITRMALVAYLIFANIYFQDV
jgi:hypothetical protein